MISNTLLNCIALVLEASQLLDSFSDHFQEYTTYDSVFERIANFPHEIKIPLESAELVMIVMIDRTPKHNKNVLIDTAVYMTLPVDVDAIWEGWITIRLFIRSWTVNSCILYWFNWRRFNKVALHGFYSFALHLIAVCHKYDFLVSAFVLVIFRCHFD